MRLDPHSPAFTVLLGTIAALPPLSIDMGLPALPLIEARFGSSPGEAGLLLSLFTAAFALAQIVFGPLSDSFGRRPILLTGCLIYLAASVGCTLAPSMAVLVGCRILAGVGAGASTVLAFAIVRDLFEGRAGRTMLSYVGMVQSVAPVIAPTIGVGVLALGGWRSIYGMLALVGLGLTTAILFGLAESRDPRRARPFDLGVILGGYARVLTNRQCVGHVLAGALSFGCLFAYISGSPLVLMGDLGVSARLFGLLFALTSGSIMAGAAINGRLSARGVPATVPLATGLALLGTSALAALVILASGRESVAGLVPVLMLNSLAFGLVISNAVHAVLEPMPEIAGIASSVFGCCQFLAGALSSGVAAALFTPLGPASMAAAMTVFALGALASWLFIARAGRTTLAAKAPGA